VKNFHQFFYRILVYYL